MEALLSRYRNLTVLLIVVVGQLLYLAYQVKTNRDERLIRVWSVSAVTPMAGVVEAVRHNTIGFLEDYFILLDVREQNRKLKSMNDRLRMENVYYRNQLSTAENARALTLFQSQTPSKTVAARVIGNSTVVTAKAVFIDRGSKSCIEKGMSVLTTECIVGKVASVYPLVSQVLLVTDPTFKVGIESQKGHVHGVLNCGTGKCSVEQVQNEEKVDKNEWFFTSGEDRIFPKGFPVGTAVSVQPGQGMKDIKLNLSGSPGGVDEVLVVLQGVHQVIPTAPVVEETTAKMLPPPVGPDDTGAPTTKPQTEADKVVEKYTTIGKEQNHAYGAYGSTLPNFNQKAPAAGAQAAAGTPAAAAATATPAEKKPTAPASVDDRESAEPSVLGARPDSTPDSPDTPIAKRAVPNPPAPKPSTPKPSAPRPAAIKPPPTDTSPRPVLPLGAPRHKTAPPPTSTEPGASPQ